jgi:peptidoglycan/LPS O-acetylase OafA/YrhL
MLAILMAVLPVATAARPESLAGRILESRVLTFVGRISYSLYLWQELFFPVFSVEATLGWMQVWPWNLLPAFGMAVLSYHFVEGPSIAYGKTIQGRRAGTLKARASTA